MKKMILILIGVYLLLVGDTNSAVLENKEKITIKVVDESGKTVEGAIVEASFERNTSQGTQVTTERGKTDADGFFTATGSGNGFVSFGAHKDGFYDSYYSYTFSENDVGRWQPWNLMVDVLLRKIEKPVPMYARNTKLSTIEIPEINKDIGFDLAKFDWVIPYGSGTHADFIFHLKRQVVDRKNFDATLTITFSNKFDGIQPYREELKDGSLFKLPRYAPEIGYKKELVLREWRHQGEATVHRNFDFNAKDLNHIFRVRSTEEDGKIAEAMYGKIVGGLRFDPVFSKTAKIYFKYYLNPDYTRNLEFDPKRNLFGNLPDLERVTEP